MGTHRKQGPTFEHLNLHTHLEHVGRWCHRDFRLTRFGQHLANCVRRTAFQTSLIDRACDDIIGTHRQCSSHSVRRRNSARCTDPDFGNRWEFLGQMIPQGDHRREKHHSWLVVRVAARIRFSRQVIS